MNWLRQAVNEVVSKHPDGEIIVETGSAPSGPYHVGHLREIITADAIVKQLQKSGRQAKQVHFLDDFDALRKIPAGISDDYQKYLGRPLADIPSPDKGGSYADYFFKDFIESAQKMGVEMEVKRGRQEYTSGFFTEAIEIALENTDKIREILETVSGRKLEDTWSPIQVMEDEYLKKRPFVKLDKFKRALNYLDKDGNEQTVAYNNGKVKLDWRIDWPARWWLLKVAVEPSGRDHSTKGGSIDTGVAIIKQVFENEPPVQVAYDFVNRAGDTKKMSASQGTGISAAEVLEVLPPEIVRYFMLRYPPSKRLFFDPDHVAQLIDEYAELAQKDSNSELVELCKIESKPVISSIPFSHLVESYQAASRNIDETVKIVSRTHPKEAQEQKGIIIKELNFIQQWLENWAPDDVKFNVEESIGRGREQYELSIRDVTFLNKLADEIENAPQDADGEWFHKAIYEIKESMKLEPKDVFVPVYKALITKEQGPRAGWFLSTLYHDRGRDWLVKRLRLED